MGMVSHMALVSLILGCRSEASI
ncbi:protein of unknown function [Micropruina glycogenica]|uniref:Uncharacterized protein n=1 Tax=Micropruina glycogenica TaxID=75385 RepID=A0A2N9JDF4_9ACTN|nr:protein of unknown function [Micropruina glycogenica]